jgi:hypothetical protein
MGILAGIGGLAGLSCPEVMHLVSYLLPDIESGPFATVRPKPAIVFGEIIAHALKKAEVAPSALAGKRELPCDR